MSDTPAASHWLAVISAEHVRRAVDLGIAQVNHGSKAGVSRMHAGDTLVYYSPTEARGDKKPLRAFTALGTISDDEIWQADEGEFTPWRRRVDYAAAVPVGLADVTEALEMTQDAHWGYRLRLGLVPLSEHDAAVLRGAMLP